MSQKEKHFVHRSSWLRASILGANDGIISVSSILMGLSAASLDKSQILIGGIAALVAGALSMAAGEYVSVGSQLDLEKADIDREEKELKNNPQEELEELSEIYIRRGLNKELAFKVAQELSKKDPLKAHIRDELGIIELTQARPLEAALMSAISFAIGAILPLSAVILFSNSNISISVFIITMLALAILGAIGAVIGGAKIIKASFRVVIWGVIAMGITALVGKLFGVSF